MIQSLIRSAPAALAALFFCAVCPAQTAPSTHPTTRQIRDAVDRDEEMRELLGEQGSSAVDRLKGRMDQSAQRLRADNDPGAQTQEIQRRILSDIDDLIDAINRHPPRPNNNKSGNSNDPKDPTKGPQSTGQNQPAPNSEKPKPSAQNTNPSPELQERSQAFMQIAPRAVPAVIEGATEQISPKYRNLVEAYYKAIAAAGNNRQ